MQRAGELTSRSASARKAGSASNSWSDSANNFEAINYLDQEGISHRDVKPENLGIGSISGGGKLRLCSSTSRWRASRRHIRAGTPPYLEPFLRSVVRSDGTLMPNATRSVTFYQMATGQRPVWGDGVSEPPSLIVRPPRRGKFDAVIREPYSFFRKLSRDYRQR
jgi:serine/threonine protein kinase